MQEFCVCDMRTKEIYGRYRTLDYARQMAAHVRREKRLAWGNLLIRIVEVEPGGDPFARMPA